MWTWDQSAGELRRDGAFISKGYSGKGRGVNNPALENIPGIGPIPTGDYSIVEKYNSKNVGPYALKLEPMDGGKFDTVDRVNRSAFRIHGDSVKAPGTASKGCIILPRVIRERIWKSGDRLLRVVT